MLAATTAFGKTVVAAQLIARRGVNTLVLVHRRQLLDQWIERLSTFLGLPRKSIGRIGGGRNTPTGLVDVAIIQSLVKKGVVDDRVDGYGHLVVDECHHLSAHSFEQVARQAKARFVLGLSATVARKDGHHPIIFMQCGPVRHRVNARAQAAARPFEHYALVQPTSFQAARAPEPDRRLEFQTLYRELVEDDARNRRICEDVIESLHNGRSPLVLTERNEHLDRLERGLAENVRHLVALRAGLGKKQRQAIADRLASIPGDEPRVILATGKYLGEGFDDSRLDTLFLTLPVSWRGTIAQYAGRLHRLHDGKREVRVYDYADLNVPMLARMFDRRCRGYEAIGYTVLSARERHPRMAGRCRAAVGSCLETRLFRQRAPAGEGRRRFTARESLRSRGAGSAPRRGWRSTRAQCLRGISLPTTRDARGNEESIRCQHEVAHSVRWCGEPGGRSSMCGRTRCGGAGWCAASR